MDYIRQLNMLSKIIREEKNITGNELIVYMNIFWEADKNGLDKWTPLSTRRLQELCCLGSCNTAKLARKSLRDKKLIDFRMAKSDYGTITEYKIIQLY